jgi:hypothetical protein
MQLVETALPNSCMKAGIGVHNIKFLSAVARAIDPFITLLRD